MQHVVGVTLGRGKVEPYLEAIHAVGLKERVLRFTDLAPDPNVLREEEYVAAAQRSLQGLRGLLLSGGADIDPNLLGGDDAHHPAVYGAERGRDLYEKALFLEAWRKGMPILAICRGMQLLNWVMGGTLYADIDDLVHPKGQAKGHRQTDRDVARGDIGHTIEIDARSRLASILGSTSVPVNSIHHQAVRDIAPGLAVVAVAPDGVVEALEAPNYPQLLAVQFHPEEMWRSHPPMRRLFEAFAADVVQAAAA